MSSQHFSPDYTEFCRQIPQAGLIPVYKKVIADLDTPLTIFAKVARELRHAFLFESMEGGEKWGRYSFIGFDPLLTFSSKGGQVTIQEDSAGAATTHNDVNPLSVLKDIVNGFNAMDDPNLPRFCGGAVGFLGYEMVRFMEELPDSKEALDLPDSSFMVPRIILAHDSFRQTVTVICWVRVSEHDDAENIYQEAQARIDGIVRTLRKPLNAEHNILSVQGTEKKHQFTSNISHDDFSQMVEKAREYIRSGDIIQVVLSQRFHTKTAIHPLTLYRALRHINPSPYLFFLQLDDIVQIGSSPEILVRKTEDTIELRPIAGTRKRGKTQEEDLLLEKELLADPKERAEHLMLVDLGRNDVGRIAKGGSVEVKDLLVIEKYSHVMHIVSGVHGKIADDKDQFDVMSACFPAGTVSGAPKIRAMEIIDELEPQKRGPYAGSVGYFGFSGNMDFCITIRTFVMQNDNLWVQAGAGIVSDSIPEKEFEETINKAKGLMRAVELVEMGF